MITRYVEISASKYVEIQKNQGWEHTVITRYVCCLAFHFHLWFHKFMIFVDLEIQRKGVSGHHWWCGFEGWSTFLRNPTLLRDNFGIILSILYVPLLLKFIYLTDSNPRSCFNFLTCTCLGNNISSPPSKTKDRFGYWYRDPCCMLFVQGKKMLPFPQPWQMQTGCISIFLVSTDNGWVCFDDIIWSTSITRILENFWIVIVWDHKLQNWRYNKWGFNL